MVIGHTKCISPSSKQKPTIIDTHLYLLLHHMHWPPLPCIWRAVGMSNTSSGLWYVELLSMHHPPVILTSKDYHNDWKRSKYKGMCAQCSLGTQLNCDAALASRTAYVYMQAFDANVMIMWCQTSNKFSISPTISPLHSPICRTCTLSYYLACKQPVCFNRTSEVIKSVWSTNCRHFSLYCCCLLSLATFIHSASSGSLGHIEKLWTTQAQRDHSRLYISHTLLSPQENASWEKIILAWRENACNVWPKIVCIRAEWPKTLKTNNTQVSFSFAHL